MTPKEIKRNIVFSNGMTYFLKYTYLDKIVKQAVINSGQDSIDNWMDNYIINHFEGNSIKMVESLHLEGYIKPDILKTRLDTGELKFYEENNLDKKIIVLEHKPFKHPNSRPKMIEGLAIFEKDKFDLLTEWPYSYNRAYLLKDSEKEIQPVMICLSGKSHEKYWKHRRNVDVDTNSSKNNKLIEVIDSEGGESEYIPFKEVLEKFK